MHEEVGRFNVELLADVLADQGQGLAALAAFAAGRLMTVDDALQLGWQGLTSGTWTLVLRLLTDEQIALTLQLGFHGNQINFLAFFKQITLLSRKGFALVGESNAAMLRQFELQGGNRGVGRLDDVVLYRHGIGQLLCMRGLRKQGPYRVEHGRVKVGVGQFVEQIHEPSLPGSAYVYKQDRL